VLSAEFTVTDDPAARASELLAEAAGKGGHVVVTGGSTPRAAYERAATLLDDWSAVELWFSDERCVPPEHEHSNYGMVKAALLDRIEGRAPGVHRMEGELGPHDGAAAYEKEFAAAGFGDALPAFDLMLLGLGPDTHVCSLFPGNPALGERERTVVGVDTPGMAPLVSRITLTLPVVNAARRVVVLVTGEDKAEAVRRAFSGAPDPSAPGSLVRPESGPLEVLLDPDAASLLEGAE
jgi:6-phosphogluconolactonase